MEGVVEMLTMAIPKIPANEPKHPGSGVDEGEIASVTACGIATGDAWILLMKV